MNVTIYGTKSCSACDRAKALLESRDMAYEYKDIADSVKAYHELSAYGNFRTVPQIIVDDWHLGGYEELVAFINSQELKDGGML